MRFFGLGGGLQVAVPDGGSALSIGEASTKWSLWTLDAEAGIHLPLGRVEPYFTFAAGYAKLVTGDAFALAPTDVTIRGFNARIGMGIDYYADAARSASSVLRWSEVSVGY